MAEYTNRKRDPCTSYKKEERTTKNTFQCCPPSPDLLCGRRKRHKHDNYECCPPTPVELRCSICWTAERDGCNIWNCVPFMSYTNTFGPTLADVLIPLLNLLPLSFLACLGIVHPRCCSVTPCPPVVRCDSPRDKSPFRICEKKVKKPCAAPKLSNQTGGGDCIQDELTAWMHIEYEALTRDLAEMKKLTQSEKDSDSQDMIEARNYVLDRLAELLAKREEIEKRMKKKRERNCRR